MSPETLILLIRWAIGLGVSLGLGTFGTEYFRERLLDYMDLPKLDEDEDTRPVPGRLTGITERLFFTVIIAFQVSGAAVAMMAWLGAKMAANWNRQVAETQGDPVENVRRRRGAIAALVTGLVSMLFAAVGGLIAGS